VCPQSPLGVLKNCVLCGTLCIVERGSNNSREARRVDFVWLRTNDARIVSTHSLLTPGLPLLLPVSYCIVTRRLLIELCAVIS
jgi:hypothetical protein